MRYQINLIPLEPFLFGGDNTYGQIGDKDNGTYITHSRLFPQQSAILGMLKKEIMTQSGILTRKVRGEWVDKQKTDRAKTLVGNKKFDIFQTIPQNFGVIKNISPIFLQRDGKIIFKKANIKKFAPVKIGQNYLLKGFTSKDDIFDNFESLDGVSLKTEDIFIPITQTLNQKQASENSLYKKTSYKLKDGFSFVFYVEVNFELQGATITLGADRSSFQMSLTTANETPKYQSEHLVLLSDSYITALLKENCDFAITSEITHQNLINQKGVQKDKKTDKNCFKKSDKVYLYEKGSVIINPSQNLLDNLNNKNLQQIGYNIHTQIGEK